MWRKKKKKTELKVRWTLDLNTSGRCIKDCK